MDRQTNEFVTFDKWFRTLQVMSNLSYGFEIGANASSAWQEYYDDGFTPREAIDEDTYSGV